MAVPVASVMVCWSPGVLDALRVASNLFKTRLLCARVQASPTDLPECEAEGKVVCSQGHIKGQPGAQQLSVPLLLWSCSPPEDTIAVAAESPSLEQIPGEG